jgi:hypothetical protein
MHKLSALQNKLFFVEMNPRSTELKAGPRIPICSFGKTSRGGWGGGNNTPGAGEQAGFVFKVNFHYWSTRSPFPTCMQQTGIWRVGALRNVYVLLQLVVDKSNIAIT